MWILSVDIETTGLDPETCEVIQVGCVLDNTNWWKETGTWGKLPTIEFLVKPQSLAHGGTTLRGEPFVLAMNHQLIANLVDPKYPQGNIVYADNVGWHLKQWLCLHGPDGIANKPLSITGAGKNFGFFDLQFLKKLPLFEDSIKFVYRCLDVGSIYFDPALDHEKLPDLKTCLSRGGLQQVVVEHTALSDARAVAALIRSKYGYNPF